MAKGREKKGIHQNKKLRSLSKQFKGTRKEHIIFNYAINWGIKQQRDSK